MSTTTYAAHPPALRVAQPHIDAFDPIAAIGTNTPAIAPAMQRLIADIERERVSKRQPLDAAQRVAASLKCYLGEPDLLLPAQCSADPHRYVVHEAYDHPAGDFLIRVLAWFPGTATPIHDHSSWCVSGVYRGHMQETQYTLTRLEEVDGRQEVLIPASSNLRCAGDVEVLVPPGDIHTVMNTSTQIALSIHIYGADIRGMVMPGGRIYDLPVIAERPKSRKTFSNSHWLRQPSPASFNSN